MTRSDEQEDGIERASNEGDEGEVEEGRPSSNGILDVAARQCPRSSAQVVIQCPHDSLAKKEIIMMMQLCWRMLS